MLEEYDRMTKSICILPARGGSKRIPNKNIKNFKGKPILSHAINIALQSKLFERVIVSTDSPQIAEIAEISGAEVPFLRPSEISDDYTTTRAVILHAIDFLENEFYDFDTICCMYPTSIFVDPKDLRESYEQFGDSKNKYCISGVKIEKKVARAFFVKNQSIEEMLYPNLYHERTQDIPDLYLDAGQFYWANIEVWKRQENVFSNATKIFEMAYSKCIDIDEENDWNQAEKLWEKNYV